MTEKTQKLCECGCGNPAPIAKKTRTKQGHIKGEPIRFIYHHQKKKFCVRGHELNLVGRAKNGRCAKCTKDVKKYENMTQKQIALAKLCKERSYNKLMSDQIRKMIKQTKNRIYLSEKKLKEGYSGNWL